MLAPDLLDVQLQQTRQPVRLGLTDLPPGPGVYAIYGDETAWEQLGLGERNTDGLAYLGQTLDGLDRRVMRTHFAKNKTPWSIVRRSLASLLRTELDLVAETSGSEAIRHFSLAGKGDTRLSKWMRNHLEIAYWECDDLVELQATAKAALADRQPALAPFEADTDLQRQVELARQEMSDLARSNLPAPLITLLNELAGGKSVEPLGQGKATWVSGFDVNNIWLETELTRSKGSDPQSLPTSQFVASYITLRSEGLLTRAGLPSKAQRRSSFVFAALAQLDGVEAKTNPLSLRMVSEDE